MGRHREYTNPTPANEAKARAFMAWYGENIEELRRYVRGGALPYDGDLFADAFLRAYDAILRRGTDVTNKTAYFLQTYRATFLDSRKTPGTNRADEREVENLTAPDFDTGTYETVVDALTSEIMQYVNDNYAPEWSALFEIYIGLYPDTSYKRLSDMLGFKQHEVWFWLGLIRRDVVEKFSARKGFLLSTVDF